MAVTTNAREAAWNALNNYSELTPSPFNRKYTHDGTDPKPDGVPTSGADLPAVTIVHSPISTTWFAHIIQQYNLVLQIRIWTPRHKLSTAEDLIEKAIDAMFKAAPEEGAPSYIKSATGHHPALVGPITFQNVQLQDAVKAVEASAMIGLKALKYPFNS